MTIQYYFVKCGVNVPITEFKALALLKLNEWYVLEETDAICIIAR